MTLAHLADQVQDAEDFTERLELEIARLESLVEHLREALCDPCLTFPQRQAIGKDDT